MPARKIWSVGPSKWHYHKTFTPTRLFFDPPTVKGASGEGGQIDSSSIKIGDYCVVYTDRGMSPDRPDRMGAWRSKDMIHWEDISLQMRFPPKTQHGSVLRVPRSVVDQLTAEAAIETPQQKQVVH